jgi:hypothetical protein
LKHYTRGVYASSYGADLERDIIVVVY